MALTAAGAQLTAGHYRSQLALRAAILRDLVLLWPLFDPTDFATFDAFSALASGVVVGGRRTSAGLALAYLEAFARAEGRPPLPLRTPPVLDRAVVTEALRATGLVGVLNARRAGQPIEAARNNGWVRLAGSATSLVLGGGREAVTDTITATGGAVRWQRVTGPEPCAFCAMLASRGAVFGEDTVDFAAHDHCSCTAEPAYPGSQLPPTSERLREAWERSTEGLSGQEALRAFREDLDANRVED
jgi:hypothetical protein